MQSVEHTLQQRCCGPIHPSTWRVSSLRTSGNLDVTSPPSSLTMMRSARSMWQTRLLGAWLQHQAAVVEIYICSTQSGNGCREPVALPHPPNPLTICSSECHRIRVAIRLLVPHRCLRPTSQGSPCKRFSALSLWPRPFTGWTWCRPCDPVRNATTRRCRLFSVAL